MPEKASLEYRGDAAASAFDRVLEAEAAAETAVEECRRQAAELVATAREQRATLQPEIERRIAAWRLRLASKADARVAQLEHAAARCTEAGEPSAAARERITQAVARLADQLIGED